MASKLMRNLSQSQRLKFVALVIGCFLISLAFILMSRPQSVPLPSVSQLESPHVDQTPVATVAKGDVLEEGRNNSAVEVDSSVVVDMEEEEVTQDDALPPGAERKVPLCDVSNPRLDICDMAGDIRITGNSSAVVIMEAAARTRQESWTIKPYPRKGDDACSNRVREVTVKSSHKALRCTVRHDVPAIFFSTGGFAGNLFHDFADLLIPLFLTAREFDGNVRFVVSDFRPYWIYKYLSVFQKLSKYPVIDHANDKQVNCFKRVIVGLRSHKEMGIDPWRAANGYSMADFTKFMRSAYSLEREVTTDIEGLLGRRPRLLVIVRRRSLAFTNVHEIAQLADSMGFDVLLEEADAGADVAKLAHTVNSCDVLLGVHGSGLTNLVFLPPNATVIQVVPWGGLEGMAMNKFGDPAKEMKLNYMQYSISVEESTLTDIYPRDHPVFKDPFQIHKQGWGALQSSTFMAQQNVKLDVNNFKNVLWKALEHAMH